MSDLDGAANAYLTDGAYLDAARLDLAAGDVDPALAALIGRVTASADEQRVARDRAFAAAFSAQGAGTAPEPDLSAGTLRIEQVLDAVVVPLASDGPVLLLVIDGLSHAAAIPLLDDLRNEGWRTCGPDGRALPPVLAVAPTVTTASRASLLTGTLTTGGQDVERTGFSSHSGMLGVVDEAPALFHKADLRTVDGQVAPEARAALANPEQHVVGVVFNGVDDFLGGGDQLELREGLDGLPLLKTVLDAAWEAGRRVVLTSDHGHVLGGQEYVAGSGGGERYRAPDGGPASEAEVELAGPRVVVSGGRIVAAADDLTRYVTAKKHGYHGGATPAEALCPLHVLVAGTQLPDGWAIVQPRPPGWWTGEQRVTVDTSMPAPKPEPKAMPTLFDEPAGNAADDWIEALLASDRFAAQRQLAGRTAADEHTVRVVLRVLDANGDSASGALLEQALGTTSSRLRGRLNGVRALLDVEGYSVLKVEPDGSVRLERGLLGTQFGVDAESPRG